VDDGEDGARLKPLRDDVGEDRNLSGSSTFRTLPDQPADEDKTEGDEDARSRQSNR